MASQAAKAVAREVLEVIGKGEIANISEIAPKHGYAKSTAISGEVQKTKSYQEEIEPVIEMLMVERKRAITLMHKKISKAKYRDLVESIDKLTKNIQLLTGGRTISADMHFTWDVE